MATTTRLAAVSRTSQLMCCSAPLAPLTSSRAAPHVEPLRLCACASAHPPQRRPSSHTPRPPITVTGVAVLPPFAHTHRPCHRALPSRTRRPHAQSRGKPCTLHATLLRSRVWQARLLASVRTARVGFRRSGRARPGRGRVVPGGRCCRIRPGRAAGRAGTQHVFSARRDRRRGRGNRGGRRQGLTDRRTAAPFVVSLVSKISIISFCVKSSPKADKIR